MSSQKYWKEETEDEIPGLLDYCLVCCSKVDIGQNQIKNDTIPHPQLSKNLSVIFLLRNLLQVPIAQVEKNLKEYGNPENWINLCDQCTELTRQAEEMYLQIVKIDREFRSIRNLIVDKIRSGSCDHDDDGIKQGNNWKGKNIWKKTRNFVVNCNFFIDFLITLKLV